MCLLLIQSNAQRRTSLAQNSPIIQQQFCPSEVKQPLAKFATGYNLSQSVDDVKFCLRHIASRRRKRTFLVCTFFNSFEKGHLHKTKLEIFTKLGCGYKRRETFIWKLSLHQFESVYNKPARSISTTLQLD